MAVKMSMLKVLPHEAQRGERRVRSMWKTAEELQELHGDKLELNDTQYSLWARMIVTGIHGSKDTPPQVPLITGVTPKQSRLIHSRIPSCTQLLPL